MTEGADMTAGHTEQVVLLDEQGHPIGVADKHAAHHRQTPLHLAFSCYVFSERGELLVTRRAAHKKTWPGEWTNSACGHPAPGEDIIAAVRRRTGEELGIGLQDLRVVLPAFRYRATMPNGVTENEFCPVFAAVTVDEPHPDPDEVAATEWVRWAEFRDDVVAGRRKVSPWCATQLAQLTGHPDNPLDWEPADTAALPPAAGAGQPPPARASDRRRPR